MELFVTFTIISEMTPIIFLLEQFSSNSKEEHIFNIMFTTHMENYNQIYRMCTEYVPIYHMHVFNK